MAEISRGKCRVAWAVDCIESLRYSDRVVLATGSLSNPNQRNAQTSNDRRSEAADAGQPPEGNPNGKLPPAPSPPTKHPIRLVQIAVIRLKVMEGARRALWAELRFASNTTGRQILWNLVTWVPKSSPKTPSLAQSLRRGGGCTCTLVRTGVVIVLSNPGETLGYGTCAPEVISTERHKKIGSSAA